VSEENPNKVGDSASPGFFEGTETADGSKLITLPQYLNILTGATVRFGEFLKKEYPDLQVGTEDDWWAQWESWISLQND